MRIILLGPPGAGKGTQAVRIADRLNVPHISTGAMFRKAVREGTDLGRKAKQFMDAGKLVPDEVTIGIVRERLAEPDTDSGFVLDGFPRTLPQAEALSQVLADMDLELDAVPLLDIGDDMVVGRITGRRICKECGATYHVEFDPPEKDGICDECGGDLYQRDDDSETTVRERLRVYHEQTSPLIDYYDGLGLLRDVPAEGTIDEVTERLLSALNQ